MLSEEQFKKGRLFKVNNSKKRFYPLDSKYTKMSVEAAKRHYKDLAKERGTEVQIRTVKSYKTDTINGKKHKIPNGIVMYLHFNNKDVQKRFKEERLS